MSDEVFWSYPGDPNEWPKTHAFMLDGRVSQAALNQRPLNFNQRIPYEPLVVSLPATHSRSGWVQHIHR